MRDTTRDQLLQLNREFYEKVSKNFDSSRSYSWDGWEILWSQHLSSNPTLSVLDLGSGNSRFYDFMKSKGWSGQYVGLEENRTLSNLAKQRYGQYAQFKSHQKDLFEYLSTDVDPTKSDLIVVFGVMHHIPSRELRVEMLKQCCNRLGVGGKLVLTFWEFLSDPRYDKRQVDPVLVGLKQSDLDDGDYILDWKRGAEAYRYCHSYDEHEIAGLLREAGLTQTAQYLADGKSGVLNRYVVAQKLV